MGQLSLFNSPTGHRVTPSPAGAERADPSQVLNGTDFSTAHDPAVRKRLTAAMGPATTVIAGGAFARSLTQGHYENFSVVSLLLPKHLRQDFCNVYAFCRIADDMADELSDSAQATAALARLQEETLACYAGRPGCTLFAALGETIGRHEIPPEPFLDLIDAFRQDQRVSRYQSFDQVTDYCRRSANPVGRLVLYMSGYRDERRQRLSDQTCTALQLANFWQDVRRDLLDRDRIYLPDESMERFGVNEAQIRDGRVSDAYRDMLRELVDRSEAMFDEGDNLLPLLRLGVRRQVALFGRGGRAVLSAIRRQNYDTLTRRPVISRWTKARLILATVVASLTRSLGREGRA